MLMLCPICAGEFETQRGVCLSCGCVLVPSSLGGEVVGTPDATAEKKKVEFVELCRPQTNPEAMFIKETLEQNNVGVMIQGMHSLSLLPQLAFGGHLRVLVPRDQLEYAQALYKAYFESEEGSDYSEEE
jgi:Putative prokaryotic signal transducing protein